MTLWLKSLLRMISTSFWIEIACLHCIEFPTKHLSPFRIHYIHFKADLMRTFGVRLSFFSENLKALIRDRDQGLQKQEVVQSKRRLVVTKGINKQKEMVT